MYGIKTHKWLAISEYLISNMEARLKGFSIRPKGQNIPKDALLVIGLKPPRPNLRYLCPIQDSKYSKENIVMRVNVGRPPIKPYILREQFGEVVVFTPPGALIKRAMFLKDMGEIIKAVSDLRQCFLTNIAELEEIPEEIIKNFAKAEKLWQLAYRPGTDCEGKVAASKAFDAFCKLNKHFKV